MPLSLRAYARHRGCVVNAVHEAISAGRLSKSIVRVKGKPKVRSAAAADAEWEAGTYTDRVPLSGPAAGAHANGNGASPLSLVRARLNAAKAEIAELELAERLGELVAAKDVEDRLAGIFTRCRTRILSIPSRLRQQDPTLTAAQLLLAEELLREALEELSSPEPAPAKRAAR